MKISGTNAFIDNHLVEVLFIINLLALLLYYSIFFLIFSYHRVSLGLSFDQIFVHVSQFFELRWYIISIATYWFEILTCVDVILYFLRLEVIDKVFAFEPRELLVVIQSKHYLGFDINLLNVLHLHFRVFRKGIFLL